jgi:outer membrane receptor protein involved in Fe transport
MLIMKRLIEGQKNWETGNEDEFRFQLDYVHPFTKTLKLEAGYQTRLDREFEWNDVHWYNAVDDYEPSSASTYYNESYFSRDIHSAYTTFSGSENIFGYKLGIRTEHTDRSIDYSGASEAFEINRWDFFPSAHFSLKLPFEQQFTASYSRRIQRPRGYYLEPFTTYVNAYSIRQGNPEIEPEYINSYEVGYQKQLQKGFISTEIYHRKTINKIERLRSVYSENVMLQTIDNIGEDFSTGVELMLNYRPTKWWNFNLMGNLYSYKVQGVLYDEEQVETSENWHARLGNTFTLTKTTKLQFDAMYHAPTNSIQGRREGFAFTNLAVRQDFLDNKLNLTFSIRDVLQTAKFGFKSSGPDFYSERSFDMDSPVYSVTLSYKINNYRKKRGNSGSGEGSMMDMGEGDY